MQVRSTRSIALLAGTLALAALALALPRSAEPSPGDGAEASAAAPDVTAKILRTSQRAILKTGKLRARVKSRQAGLVALRAKLRPEAGGRARRIAKVRRVRFKGPGSRKVKLKLSKKGRRIVADCAPKNLILKVGLRPAPEAGAAAKRNRSSRRAPLRLDSLACPRSGAGSPGGGTGPGGGDPGGGGPGGGDPGGGDPGGGDNGNVIPEPQPYSGPAIDTLTSTLYGCDFLVPDSYDPSSLLPLLHSGACLQPWPNDYFTRADGSTDTGKRIDLNLLAMPRTQPLGIVPLPVKPIGPGQHNKNDGFSPGNMIVVKVPGLDSPEAFEQTGAVGIDDPGAYADPDQPVVVINAESGERHPVWAEVDANPANPGDRNLIIRPLVNFDEGARYVVGLREMKNAAGETIAPSNAFRAYRDNLTTGVGPIESRRPHMEDLFEVLGQAGIQRSGLHLAWDFTVASERNLSERMLSIRDRAFDQLGDSNLADGVVEGDSPAFGITGVNADTGDPRIAKIVTGTVRVPCFMTLNCSSIGSVFNNLGHPDGIPQQNGTTNVEFRCLVPNAAISGGEVVPARPSLYGHGLLGSAQEGINAGNVRDMSNEHNVVSCATDWYGFATQNLANILLILQDLSLFPLLADGTQQGFLNFLYLGRLMIHPDGLISDPAFQQDGEPLIDTTELFYDGNSQGGILGGALTAVAPDFKRAVLGVPGMNYSTLLRRSVDFEPYAEGQFTGQLCGLLPAELQLICDLAPEDTPLGLYDNYPNEFERPVILSLMQMLWDRGDANGYAHHMTDDPLPNTPPHQVLLQAAFGDHQVANVTAEVEARTIGASVYQPALDPGRHWEADGSEEIFGIPSIDSFPFDGSALVYWDGGPLGFPGGTATPPNENIPPRPDQGFGADPHSYPRSDVKGRAQKSAFLSVGGSLRNPCTTANNLASPPLPIAFENGDPIPCYAHGWLGP